MFAELHCLSHFTFLRGASSPECLVQTASQLGYHAIAVTDECSLAGIVRAHLVAQALDIQLIVGAEFSLVDCPGTWILLAPDRLAYRQLCQVISDARMRATKGSYRMDMALLQKASGCIALWRPELARRPKAEPLRALTAHFYRFAVVAEWAMDGCDEVRRRTVLYWQAQLECAVVASCGAEMHAPSQLFVHHTLAAIREGQPLATMGDRLAANAARHLWPLDKLKRWFPNEWLDATVAIANLCHFSLDELRYQYPSEVIPHGREANEYLAELTWQGARERWPEGWDDELQARIEKELRIIRELGFAHYFLTVYDIVRFARTRRILCQGRGSAANSVVCFCLGITSVDPKRIDVLFERFVSEARHEPPDIDIDFEHERREEVIQYLYQKYGRHKAALTAVVITYRWRSAVRDVGKALGFSETEIKSFQRELASMDEAQFRIYLRDIEVPERRHLIACLWRCVHAILGFPRHLSQHVGGFVLSEQPLSELVPVEPAAMEGRSVVQWDKDDLKALGIMKVDILALGMLTAIRK
ncbi:MAG: PHP domain-containing protein, partial [Gammaproteobacteria bacterium]